MKLRHAIAVLCLGAVAPFAGAQDNVPATESAANTDLARRLSEVVARVGTKEIRRRDVAFLIQVKLQQRNTPIGPDKIAAFERDALEELIGRQLLLDEAKGNEPKDLDQKVADQMAQAVKQFGSDEKFGEALKQARLTREEYLAQLREGTLFTSAMERMIKEHGPVTAEEVQSFYDANKDGFRTPELVAVSHILVRASPEASDEVRQAKRAQIEAARSLVRGGENFAAVARKVSDDPNTADNGGALGVFRRGQLPPDFEVAVFNLKTNEVSEVITTPAGLHVLKVTERKPSQALTLEQVKPQIEMMLRERKGMEFVRQHVADLRKTAKVEVLLPPLPAGNGTNAMPSAPATK